jgi:hypothetical protein
MSLHLRTGRLTIDQNGRTVFDSDDKLYHNITSGLVGSFSVGDRGVSGASNLVNIDNYHQIGTCNGFCTNLQGSIRFRGFAQSFPTDIWFSYEGGDVFNIVDYATGSQQVPYTITVQGLVKYKFFISDGVVWLNERVVMHSGANKIFRGHTLDWKLKAGRFT